MSFAEQLHQLPILELADYSIRASRDDVLRSLNKPERTLHDFAALISPAAFEFIESIAHRSAALTRQRFGRVMRLFAPLYLSNECVNACLYCGFSRRVQVKRLTLSLEEVEAEIRALHQRGFRNVLLVAGEHPGKVTVDYLEQCVRIAARYMPSVSLEVGPLPSGAYHRMVTAGAEGFVIYQETYDYDTYRRMHVAGPKKNFELRLKSPEEAYQAGFRRIGIGVLLGLTDWRKDAIALAAHVRYLLKYCWRSHITVSLPRLRPCAGGFEPEHPVRDRELVLLTCALRLCFPDVGLVLSTREPARLRDGLAQLGITLMSAGSHTEPGGYAAELRLSRRVEHLHEGAEQPPGRQFDIADERSPEEIVTILRRIGLDPVWKDWDSALSKQEVTV